MRSRKSLLRGISLLAAFTTAVTAVSCGTILYPERRGQSGGKLDATVVILDGIGLLFFFVPGVIAFAVDFATGAIYLPRFHFLQNEISPDSLEDYRVILTGNEHLTLSELELLLEQELDRKIELSAPDIRVAKVIPEQPLVWDSLSRTLSPSRGEAFSSD